MKKIDIHCHTTPRKLAYTVNGSADLDSIAAHMMKHDIERTVLLATYFPHRGSGISNYRLHDMIGRWHDEHHIIDETLSIVPVSQPVNRFLMFGSLDFEHYYKQGYNELSDLCAEGKIKGIKIYTTYQKIDLHGKELYEVITLAQKHKLPVMFHTGYSYRAHRELGRDAVYQNVSAEDLEHLATDFPDVNMIFSHMAKPYDIVPVLKRNKNIVTDVSGLIDSRTNRDEIPHHVETIRRFVNEVGPDQLLFGTDFPVQTHDDSVYFVEEGMRGFAADDMSKVYFGNAERLLKLGRM